MPVSDYIARIRKQIGHDLLMLAGVSAVVLNDDDEILLGRRSDTGNWSLIAGCVDPGEQPADAILREIYEETGVHAVIERLAGIGLHPITYPNGDICEFMNTWFRCRAVGGAAVVNDEESLEVGWFRRDRLPELTPFALLRIDTAMADTETAWFAPAGVEVEALGYAT
jgi:8-oxo-dGTP diphosphatase